MHTQALRQKLLVKDGEGMQVPRKLRLSGQPKFVSLLREELVKMKETMATNASKCKLNTKSIKDKYSTLKEVEDGKTKSQVAAKYGIPKNTLSTWLKNKDKILEATKKGSNSKRQRLRQGTFANLDQAMFKWLCFSSSFQN